MDLKFAKYSFVSYLISLFGIVALLIGLKNGYSENFLVISGCVMSFFAFAPTAYNIGELIYRLVRKILTLR